MAGYTGSAKVVHALTVRRHAAKTLDVGTGSGIHALLAASHSDHVVATDVNQRALAYAAFNAKLNGISNVETRLGSFFEPVADERFDLILCNPPFVVSPEDRFLFRDAGAAGDELSRDLLRAAGEHLEEDGFATVQVSWIGRDGEGWSERPKGWLEGLGCDAWIVRSHQQSPIQHAAAWNADQRVDPHRYGATIDAWVDYARELGADWICEGVVVLRRRSGARNWIRADQPSGEEHGPASEQILNVVAAMDTLGSWGDAAPVLTHPLRAAQALRIDHTFAPAGEAWGPTSTQIRLDEGVRFSAGVNPETAELVRLLHQHGTLEEALTALAERLELSDEARARLSEQAVEIVSDMWGSGYLVTRETAAEQPADASRRT